LAATPRWLRSARRRSGLWYNRSVSDEDAKSRAARRASWPGSRFTLGHEPDADLRCSTTASERLDMMWQLAVDAWVMSGRPWPSYTRADIPGRVFRSFDERNTEPE